MQKGLHAFSKAASIAILSVILRVHRLHWYPSFCQAFSAKKLYRNDHLNRANRNFLPSYPKSLTILSTYPMSSADSLDVTRNDTGFLKHCNSTDQLDSLSSELSKVMLEVVTSCNNDDATKVISGQTLTEACYILDRFIRSPSTNTELNGLIEANGQSSDKLYSKNSGLLDELTTNHLHAVLSSYASIAAERLCKIALDTNGVSNNSKKSKKRTWEALQNAAVILQSTPSTDAKASLQSTTTNKTASQLEPNALAVCMIFGALSFLQQQQYQNDEESNKGAKAAASALSSTIARNKDLRQHGRAISSVLLRCYTDLAFRNEEMRLSFDLNILNHLAKSFQLTEKSIEPRIVATIVQNAIQMTDTDDTREDLLKQAISGSFALACQIRPWSVLSPVELMEVATSYDFYHTAEEICRSAHNGAKYAEQSDDGDCSSQRYSASTQAENAVCAVEMLIDTALKDRMNRRADALATSLYLLGGRSRYVQARYLHACDTIAKVIAKRQFPIVDRQIERVDQALAKVGNSDDTDASENDPSVEIREYAIQKFEEVGEIAAAQRLASIYGIDYVYDEEAALRAAALRREKYLQYEDLLPGNIPSLISEPSELISGFEALLQEQDKLIGFDAEWDEETQGAALLQLASTKTVLLIDIPALSSSEEGVHALRETVGKLLENPVYTVIGFACRQDLSRLRASPCIQTQQPGEQVQQQEQQMRHWMSGTSSVVDVQPLIGVEEESLIKTGLSRACEHFLGKPLDKAEQCSLWSGRPLSERQRSYASLDAWVCVGIYQKILRGKNKS